MLHPLSNSPEQNNTIEMRLTMPNGPSYSFSPRVIILQENQHFAWKQTTLMAGIFDGEHHFELKSLDNNRTELLNYEHYSGILSPIIKRLPMMQDAPAGFEAMNAEIKAWSEEQYRESNS